MIQKFIRKYKDSTINLWNKLIGEAVVLSNTLEISLRRALSIATDHHHEYATYEHLLLALLDDKDVKQVLSYHNIKVDKLMEHLTRYIDLQLQDLVSEFPGEAKPTAGFQRIIQRAALHTQAYFTAEHNPDSLSHDATKNLSDNEGYLGFSKLSPIKKRSLSGADILAEFFFENETYALHILKNLGLTRQGILEAIKYLQSVKEPKLGFPKNALRDNEHNGNQKLEQNKDITNDTRYSHKDKKVQAGINQENKEKASDDTNQDIPKNTNYDRTFEDYTFEGKKSSDQSAQEGVVISKTEDPNKQASQNKPSHLSHDATLGKKHLKQRSIAHGGINPTAKDSYKTEYRPDGSSERANELLIEEDIEEKEAKEELEKYCVNLNEKARNNHIDCLIGRNNEIQRTIEVLCRRKKNNAILVGEPGVGKTAIAEGLAYRIVQKEVPKLLQDTLIYALDIGALIAGTKYRGDFEERINSMLDAFKNLKSAVLFIDEVHSIIGAGSTTNGSLDASNLLKPALARGELKCIGSTTFKEFHNHFEKDMALVRRFQKIVVEEPSEEATMDILKGLKPYYEKHHGVKYDDSALKAAISLSQRYINDRHLPDKAIDLLDEAGSRCKISVNNKQNSPMNQKAPASTEANTKIRTEVLTDNVKEHNTLFLNDTPDDKSIEGRYWKDDQRNITDHLGEQQRQKLHSGDGYSRGLINTSHQRPPLVTEKDIENVITRMLNIPNITVVSDDIKQLKKLENNLKKSIFGQDEAIKELCNSIKLSRAGLRKGSKPTGCYLFAGKTGVGKTELARQLALICSMKLLKFDMSEFSESVSVSKLIGSAPGYVGFDQGGMLTEEVDKYPYSVILFDEIEKAHPDIYNLLLQIMDDGCLTDSTGKTVDFTYSIIVLTTNIQAEKQSLHIGFDTHPNSSEKGLTRASERNTTESLSHEGPEYDMSKFEDVFSPEFRSRLDKIILFNEIDGIIDKIVDKNIKELASQLADKKVSISVSKSVKKHLIESFNHNNNGARQIDKMIDSQIKQHIADEILFGDLRGGGSIIVDFDKDRGKITFACHKSSSGSKQKASEVEI